MEPIKNDRGEPARIEAEIDCGGLEARS